MTFMTYKKYILLEYLSIIEYSYHKSISTPFLCPVFSS
jgi:hypothetical protein